MYIDSNIFIFAAMDQDELGENCRKILDMIESDRIQAASSFLVLDEVMWVIKKNIGKDESVKVSKAALSLPVKWIDVSRSVMIESLDSFQRYNLDPRDCIHLSSMKNSGITTIISEDGDFDRVSSVKRLNAATLIQSFTEELFEQVSKSGKKVTKKIDPHEA